MDPDSNKEEKKSAALDLLLSVLEYKTPGGKLKKGFCSNYLANAKPDERVALHLKSSPSFHIESQTDRLIPPTILIGAGSGLAPFRGFWQKLNQESTSKQPSESLWRPIINYLVSGRFFLFQIFYSIMAACKTFSFHRLHCAKGENPLRCTVMQLN